MAAEMVCRRASRFERNLWSILLPPTICLPKHAIDLGVGCAVQLSQSKTVLNFSRSNDWGGDTSFRTNHFPDLLLRLSLRKSCGELEGGIFRVILTELNSLLSCKPKRSSWSGKMLPVNFSLRKNAAIGKNEIEQDRFKKDARTWSVLAGEIMITIPSAALGHSLPI